MKNRDKVEELNQKVKEQEKSLRKHEWNIQDIWNTIKRPNLQIMGTEEEEMQTKGIDNLVNKIITKNFLKLEKEKNVQVQEAYRTPNHQNQKKQHPQRYCNQNT
jgi:hypothetical protein